MVTVMPYEKVLRYRNGALDTVLSAGKHRVWGLGFSYVRVDLRRSILDVAPQEIVTSDGVSVKVSASLQHVVTDPVAFHEVSEEPRSLVYDAVKEALRDAVHGKSVEELAQGVSVEGVPAVVAAAATAVGLEVVSFTVRDVIVPSALRNSYADVLEENPALAALRMIEVAGQNGATVVIERPKA
ncbi:hypothetical protein BH09ACT10_BH09ACT10_07220 [soil metagenome]